MPQNPKILEALTERNGPYSIDPTPEQINDFFTLTVDELEMIAPCRHNHTRLGMAVQVCTLKFLSTFPTDVTRVPTIVVDTLKTQLRLETVDLGRY
jgi:Domain of unknown function (DUF4158)